jgi:hypothetical protein
MPPATQIEDFDPRFFRPCFFPMLRELGYETRVSLNNALGAEDPLATDMTVSLSVFDDDGRHLGTRPHIAELAPGEIVKLAIEPLLREGFAIPDGGNLFGVLHVVPVDLAGQESVTVPTDRMMAHARSSDDFIEFRKADSRVVTGVAYQTGPMNDPRFGSTRTTVVQAPKVIVSEPVDTLFTLLNVSTSFDYDKPVRMDFQVLGPAGEQVVRSSVEVPAMTFRMVSITEVLEEAGRLEEFRAMGGVGTFMGLAKKGSLVPLSLTRNKNTGAIACDHTLPPVYYVTTWGGDARLKGAERLEAALFPELAPTEAMVSA